MDARPAFRLWRHDDLYSVQFGEVDSTRADFLTLESAIAALAGMIPFGLLQHGAAHVLHGGAVLVNGRAHLFLGPGHIGKSTLAFYAWMKGHEVIGDDYLILDPSTSSVQATPKPLKLRLSAPSPPDDFVRRAASEQYLVGQSEGAWALLLSRGLPRMTPIGRSVPIGRIHFLSRDGRAQTLDHQVTKAEAVKGIFDYLIAAPRNNLDVVRSLARLFERRAVSGLHVGHRDWNGALSRICAADACAGAGR
jgi:hypothetical protein